MTDTMNSQNIVLSSWGTLYMLYSPVWTNQPVMPGGPTEYGYQLRNEQTIWLLLDFAMLRLREVKQ